MSESSSQPMVPSEISLHTKSGLLSVAFEDGQRFELPFEYLRVFSTAADVKVLETPVVGKETVQITQVEPQGSYAIRLYFDDGHDTGIFSWGTLYQLGRDFERNWQGYLARLKAMGYERSGEAESGPVKVKVLLFSWLVELLESSSEELVLPRARATVAGALALLRAKGELWEEVLADKEVRCTVNRQLAELFSKLADGDELGVVPKSPTAPR